MGCIYRDIMTLNCCDQTDSRTLLPPHEAATPEKVVVCFLAVKAKRLVATKGSVALSVGRLILYR